MKLNFHELLINSIFTNSNEITILVAIVSWLAMLQGDEDLLCIILKDISSH